MRGRGKWREREIGREKSNPSLPSPKKQESDSLLLTTIVKEWGKAIKILGREEARFS